MENKTIEERKKDFIVECTRALLIGNQENSDEVDRFIDYWCEYSINGRKMRFEKEKVFDIKRRFATWKRNAEKWEKPKQLGYIDANLESHEQAKKLLGL